MIILVIISVLTVEILVIILACCLCFLQKYRGDKNCHRIIVTKQTSQPQPERKTCLHDERRNLIYSEAVSDGVPWILSTVWSPELSFYIINQHPENLHLRPLFCFYKGWLTRINHDSTFTLYIYIALNDFVVDVNHDLFYNHKNVAGLLLPEIYLRNFTMYSWKRNLGWLLGLGLGQNHFTKFDLKAILKDSNWFRIFQMWQNLFQIFYFKYFQMRSFY